MYVHFIESRADLPNAIALNSLLVNCARVVGPALAGMLLSVTSEAACFALNALSFVAVIVALLLIRWPPYTPSTASPGWWSSWLEGARYTSSMPAVRALLVLVATLAWTITPYTSLMPVFAKDIYGGGPHTLGLAPVCRRCGARCSAPATSPADRPCAALPASSRAPPACPVRRWRPSRRCACYPLALAFLFIAGGALILAAAGANTILQTIVEDRLRGRVAAFYTLSFLGIAPLGNLAAGALAGAIGAPLTFILNGALGLLAAGWFWRQLPAMRGSLRPIYRNLGILDEPTVQERTP